MLGVSRGTLRTALDRLEASGEIVRRQGSGTFVGRLLSPAAFREGLERLESYSSLARRRGVRLSASDLCIEHRPLAPEPAEHLGLEPGTPAPTISRLVLADGEPVGLMRDIVHPEVRLPTEARLRRAIERGSMVMDILVAQGLALGFARTRIVARIAAPRDPVGRALRVASTTAVLELEEVMYLVSGRAIQHASDVFAPGGIDLRVTRHLEAPLLLPALERSAPRAASP